MSSWTEFIFLVCSAVRNVQQNFCEVAAPRASGKREGKQKALAQKNKEQIKGETHTPFKVGYEKSFKLITFFIIRLFVFNYSTLFFQHEVTKLPGLSSLLPAFIFRLIFASSGATLISIQRAMNAVVTIRHRLRQKTLSNCTLTIIFSWTILSIFFYIEFRISLYSLSKQEGKGYNENDFF